MSATEYLWLEERVKISDGAPMDRTEWGSWPGKCLFHKNDIADQVKQFIRDIQGPILPSEESVISRLEDILCCCGNKPNQKTVVARFFGYTAGINLPHYAHEDRQNHLIEYFHNIFNNSVSVEQKEETTPETDTGFPTKFAKFLHEVLEPHRYRIYNPGVVRLLHIIKQYLEKPFVQFFEFPLVDFVRLIEGPFWEECAEKLRTKFCVDIYIDFNSEVIDAGNIGIYVGGPSLHELKSAKSNLATYMDKTINPSKEKKKASDDKSESKNTEASKPVETDDQKTEHLCEVAEEEKVCEDKRTENDLKMEDEKTAPVNNVGSVKEAGELLIIDKVRDSTSVDRSLESGERTYKDDKQTFTRSKSVPASSTMESNDLPNQRAKRAKYDSECSSEDILQPSPMQELSLFKENLKLVLMNRPEDNNNSLVNV